MLRHRMKSERGAAIVEFALVVPILLALVMGIAEFGRAFFIHATMAGAAREGVRVMALANPSSGGPGAATTAAQNSLTASGLSGLTITPGAACPASGATPANATVTITYNMPYITGMFGATKNLTATGVMRCNG